MYDAFILPQAAKFVGGKVFSATEITEMVHRAWDQPAIPSTPRVQEFLDRAAVKRYLDRRATDHHASGIKKVGPSQYAWPKLTEWDKSDFRLIAEEDQRLADFVSDLINEVEVRRSRS
jgi:hypothetical protein